MWSNFFWKPSQLTSTDTTHCASVPMFYGHHSQLCKCTDVLRAPLTIVQVYRCFTGTIHTGTTHNCASVPMFYGHHSQLCKCTDVLRAPFTRAPLTIVLVSRCFTGTTHNCASVPMFYGHHSHGHHSHGHHSHGHHSHVHHSQLCKCPDVLRAPLTRAPLTTVQVSRCFTGTTQNKCPVGSWPFVTGGISVRRIHRLQLHCLHDEFPYTRAYRLYKG